MGNGPKLSSIWMYPLVSSNVAGWKIPKIWRFIDVFSMYIYICVCVCYYHYYWLLLWLSSLLLWIYSRENHGTLSPSPELDDGFSSKSWNCFTGRSSEYGSGAAASLFQHEPMASEPRQGPVPGGKRCQQVPTKNCWAWGRWCPPKIRQL